MTKVSDGTTKELLKYERECRGWSRRYVAEKIESDPQTVGRWERGETFPSPYFRQKLCDLFGKDAEALGLIPKGKAAHVETPAGFTETQHTKIDWHGEGDDQKIRHQPNSVFHSISHYGNAGFSFNIAIAGLVAVIAAVILGTLFWQWLNPSFQLPPDSSRHPKILPGGMWVSPINGKSYSSTVHFAALAYPDPAAGPPINYVNFTAKWQGDWRIVCTVYPPVVENLYACDVNLQKLGAPPGPISISFDVYDQRNNVHFAPNGEHTILYLS